MEGSKKSHKKRHKWEPKKGKSAQQRASGHLRDQVTKALSALQKAVEKNGIAFNVMVWKDDSTPYNHVRAFAAAPPEHTHTIAQ